MRGLYPGGALWFEAPGLPECCAALLQEAIQRRYEHAGRLVPLWEEAQRGGGRIDLSALDTPTRQFLPRAPGAGRGFRRWEVEECS